MGRKFWHPSEDDLFKAFTLKSQGIRDKDIAEAIGVAHSTYNSHKKEFLKYFAKKMREERKKNVGHPRGITMDKATEKQIVNLAGLGLTIPKIAEMIGMPNRTIYHWLALDETLKHKVDTAKEKLDQEVLRALFKATSGQARERTVTTTTIKDRRGNVIGTTVTESSKILRPSVNAIKLWVLNRNGWRLSSDANGGDENDSDNVEYDVRERLYNESSDDNELNPDS